MRSSFPSLEHPARVSPFLAKGERGAVAPVSALKLLRRGIKRRRQEGGISDASKGRELNTNGNDNGNDYGEENIGSVSPRSSSPRVCLANNPFFSLPLGLTELSGPAGVGKTQIALSVCADCVSVQEQQEQHRQPDGPRQSEPQNKKKAVFIQLGGSSRFLQIAARRLEQMFRSRLAAHGGAARNNDNDTHSQPQTNSNRNAETTVQDCLTRILLHWICNSEELMELLRTSLPRLLGMHPTISIVVLDGIANLFRLLPDHIHNNGSVSDPWHDRAIAFFQISNLCKELSSRFEIPFLVLNECTSRIPTTTIQSHHKPKVVLEPALGLAWSQCVNCSFFVRRASTTTCNTTTTLMPNDEIVDHNEYNSGSTKQRGVCHRMLQCLKAPHISSKHSKAKFWIHRSGVILI